MSAESSKSNCSNFIYSKANALSIDICDEMVRIYQDELEHMGAIVSYGRDQYPSGADKRSDIQLFCPPSYMGHHRIILDTVWEGFLEYRSYINSVLEIPLYYIDQFKIQKTDIGGGYHQWHCEQGPARSANRALAWTIYLNDVEEGGETEFLYQSIRVPARAGTLSIFPAGLTHPHRGNPPLSCPKYIVTGWILLIDSDMHEYGLRLAHSVGGNSQ